MANLNITLVWVEPEREPLKATVASCQITGSFVRIVFAEDCLPPGVKSRRLVIPAHQIESLEIEEREEVVQTGYHEDNQFREEVGGVRHIPGGKLP